MKRLLFISILFLSSCHLFEDSNEDRISGVTLGFHSEDSCYNYYQMIKEIAELDSEWICIHVKLFQENIYSNEMAYSGDAHSYLEQLRTTIIQAKDMGMKVFIMPIVLLDDDYDGAHWRGILQPKDKSKWFENYQEHLTRLAKILENEKVELLSIGSEFNSMQSETAFWERIAIGLRSEFSGELTYSANWDALENIQFFEELDYAGISAYFSLTYKKDPTLEELIEGWALNKNYILNDALPSDLPILITELGYASIDSINTNPWNYKMSENLDHQEQRDCFEAFSRSWKNEERLAGVFFYEWFGAGGEQDLSYTFKDKPAEKTVRAWLKR